MGPAGLHAALLCWSCLCRRSAVLHITQPNVLASSRQTQFLQGQMRQGNSCPSHIRLPNEGGPLPYIPEAFPYVLWVLFVLSMLDAIDMNVEEIRLAIALGQGLGLGWWWQLQPAFFAAPCFSRFQHCMTNPAFLVASLSPALITCTQPPAIAPNF